MQAKIILALIQIQANSIQLQIQSGLKSSLKNYSILAYIENI